MARSPWLSGPLHLVQVVLGHQFNSASKWLLGDLVLDAGEAEAVIRDRYDFGPREPLTVTVPLRGLRGLWGARHQAAGPGLGQPDHLHR